MQKRPSIKVRPHEGSMAKYGLKGEITAELCWPDGAGCLLSLSDVQGQHRLEIYRKDETIHVVHDYGQSIREIVRIAAQELQISPADIIPRYENNSAGDVWEWVITYPKGEPKLEARSTELHSAVRDLSTQIKDFKKR